ncbi:hypothetical protein ACF1G3_39730, partial [Streptomyces rochei]|uniref:hypothetical protein n=1 Tax=Streptomyces rochei TaxID=1928 RepID=UPI003702E2EF
MWAHERTTSCSIPFGISTKDRLVDRGSRSIDGSSAVRQPSRRQVVDRVIDPFGRPVRTTDSAIDSAARSATVWATGCLALGQSFFLSGNDVKSLGGFSK